MSGALAARHADQEGEKGRVESTKVRRYWPGKAPNWAASAEGPDAEAAAAPRGVVRTAIAAPVVVKKADDPRLLRLAQRLRVTEEGGVPERHREIRSAEVVRRRRHEEDEEEGAAAGAQRHQEEQEEEEEEGQERQQGAGAHGAEAEEDEEEIVHRRQALKERLRQQQQEQELLAAQEEESEEEEETEYETDSEEDDAGARRLIKPVFVPKAARETIAEREALEAEEEQLAAQEKRRLTERKAETRQLLVEVIAAEAAAEAAQTQGPKELGDVIIDDEGEEEAAYEAWVVRERERIRRERAVREAAEKAAAERERIANMTEEERLAWERANPKVKPDEAPKQKWKFMQKYWHKGAYFQDAPDDARATAGGDEIYKRDFSAPTGEDRFDKESLPAVMQVRNFGRSGRTKWKHLAAEDTTAVAREDAYYREVPGLRAGEAPKGAAAGGYSRTIGAAGGAAGGAAKRGYSSEEFSRPKKFKT